MPLSKEHVWRQFPRRENRFSQSTCQPVHYVFVNVKVWSVCVILLATVRCWCALRVVLLDPTSFVSVSCRAVICHLSFCLTFHLLVLTVNTIGKIK
jgi:hypothetical protein